MPADGETIGTGEVESALLDHPEVHEVDVAGLPGDDLGQRVVAFVVPTSTGDPALAKRLMDHVASGLSWRRRPRELAVVDDLPRNTMGKVVKSLLVQRKRVQ